MPISGMFAKLRPRGVRSACTAGFVVVTLASAGCGSENGSGADATYVAERDATIRTMPSVTATTRPAASPASTRMSTPTTTAASVTPVAPTVAATPSQTLTLSPTRTATLEPTPEPTLESTAEPAPESTQEPTVEPTPPPPTETIHVVVEGETLVGIANQYGVSAGEIATLNELANADLLTIGQELRIPVPSP